MKRTRSFILGFISATVLTTAVSALAQTELIAKLSSQTFFWQNAKIELEAYNINGYNYVRLRDAAGIFGVDVEYNGTDNSVRLGEEPKQIFIPLTETIPEPTKEPEKSTSQTEQIMQKRTIPNMQISQFLMIPTRRQHITRYASQSLTGTRLLQEIMKTDTIVSIHTHILLTVIKP